MSWQKQRKKMSTATEKRKGNVQTKRTKEK